MDESDATQDALRSFAQRLDLYAARLRSLEDYRTRHEVETAGGLRDLAQLFGEFDTLKEAVQAMKVTIAVQGTKIALASVFGSAAATLAFHYLTNK